MIRIQLLLLILPFYSLLGASDEKAVVSQLQSLVSNPLNIERNKAGNVIGINIDAPDFKYEDFELFLKLPKLKALKIGHAGYVKDKRGRNTPSGEDFSGVSILAKHPELTHFSAGGALEKPFIDGLSKLKNIEHLMVLTTHSKDHEWGKISELTNLKSFGIRMRNRPEDNQPKGRTDHIFNQFLGLKNLEHFTLREMHFIDPKPFVDFIVSRRNLKLLTISDSNLPQAALAKIKAARPELKITIY